MAGNPGRPSTLRDDQPRRRLSRAHRTAKVLRFGKSAERQPPSLPGEPTSKQIAVLARKAPGEITPKVHAGEFMPESSCRRVHAGEFLPESSSWKFMLAGSSWQLQRAIGPAPRAVCSPATRPAPALCATFRSLTCSSTLRRRSAQAEGTSRRHCNAIAARRRVENRRLTCPSEAQEGLRRERGPKGPHGSPDQAPRAGGGRHRCE